MSDQKNVLRIVNVNVLRKKCIKKMCYRFKINAFMTDIKVLYACDVYLRDTLQ